MNKPDAIILAGGQSRRMGTHKFLLRWNGKTFLESIMETLSAFCQTIVLSGDHPELKGFGLKVITDSESGMGPLSGIDTCLDYTQQDRVLIMSCDAPQVSPAHIKRLLQESYSGKDGGVFRMNGKLLPLMGIYTHSGMEKFRISFRSGNLRVMNAVEKMNLTIIEDAPVLQNINTREQLEELG